MAQLQIFNRTWQWHGDIERLAVLQSLRPEDSRLVKVKNNPVRTVYSYGSLARPRFFLKYDHPNHWLTRLKSRFKNKTRMEFSSYELLQVHHIPIVEYLGWGSSGVDGLLISLAVPDTVSGKEYWFRIVGDNVDRQKYFLADLAHFVKRFICAGIYHPDFHVGNILISPTHGGILLVDPYGVRQVSRLTRRQRLQMAKIFVDFRGEISNSDAEQLLFESGLTTVDDAATMWLEAIAAEEKEIFDGWPRRTRQILSGYSKFSSMLIHNGGEYHVRHTLWYKCPIAPDEFEIDPAWRPCAYSRSEAERRWLNSFQQQLLRQPASSVPVLWRRNDKGDDILYYS